jgi:hypothetical protein
MNTFSGHQVQCTYNFRWVVVGGRAAEEVTIGTTKEGVE